MSRTSSGVGAFLLVFLLLVIGALIGTAVQAPDETYVAASREATGGAQTLEDILARQQGLKVDETFRSGATGDPEAAKGIDEQLGTLGGVSDPELWRALRYGTADITASNNQPGAALLVQDSGMSWVVFREGPLRTWGGYALVGMIGLLALFYLIRGRIKIESGFSGRTIERFKPVERFGHWLLAGSFVLLGITGLISLFGRVGLMPWMGKDTFAQFALYSKWVHNNVSWAFMLGLVLVFVMWVIHNIPSRTDLVWISKAGGLFSEHSHPPARKFNAGQKLIFWSTILLGISVSATGISLLFPFEIPMFAKTFAVVNDLRIPSLLAMEPLPTVLAPHEEMQLAQLWHAIVAFAMMVIIIAHIYIGSVGMQGAYAAMGSGQVDLNWAKEHHSLWVEEVQAREGTSTDRAATPAE